MARKNVGFRAWFYFRMGWGTYFAFIFAAINTLTVTYYLAIERVPILKDIFPSFLHYLMIAVTIGIPLLVFIGYMHYKKSAAYSSEADIYSETNPYYYKLPPGWQKEVLFPTNLMILNILIKLINKSELTKEEIDTINDLRDKIDKLSKGGSVGLPTKETKSKN
ncbi:MAG: hypothetical protein QXE82_06705 [Candidatus Nitrosotenuis sp.]